MNKDIEEYNTFNGIEYYTYKVIEQLASQYDPKEIPEYWKKKLHILGHICKLKERNLPLAKYVYLESLIWCKEGIEQYWGKRGRKGRKDYLPAKAIMKALHCSRRTAMDYLAMKDALADIDKFFNWAVGEVAIQQLSKTESQHDAVSNPPPAVIEVAKP